jgi:hypothetical protein
MAKYLVTAVKHYQIIVEANDITEAEEKASDVSLRHWDEDSEVYFEFEELEETIEA